MAVTPATTKPKDLVISYAVVPATTNYVDPAVQTALDGGYRVIDVVSVASDMFVAVTVVLSHPGTGQLDDGSRHHYKSKGT